jgi:hypothetical protein
MPIRCPKCGYSNDAEFRFCGMCGAPLNRQYDEPIRPKPVTPSTPLPPAKETVPAAAPPEQRRVYRDESRLTLPRIDVEGRDYAPVSGPSFLGLSPSRSLVEDAPQYLLEDEVPTGRGKFLIGLVIILAIGGGLFWQWQHEGYPWNPEPKAVSSSVSGETTEPSAAPPVSADVPPTGASTTDAAKPEAPASAAAEDTTKAKPEDSNSTVEEKPEVPAEPKVAKAAAPPVPVAKPKREVREPVPTPVDPSEALFIDGQKYLYGSGVPEDCGRARTKLIAAAGQSNAKAQSTVATMYATGHCLPRSLPSAYHWFAQALHNDRDNGRLQRDLEMIWGQMTPEEKEMAIKGR